MQPRSEMKGTTMQLLVMHADLNSYHFYNLLISSALLVTRLETGSEDLGYLHVRHPRRLWLAMKIDLLMEDLS